MWGFGDVGQSYPQRLTKSILEVNLNNEYLKLVNDFARPTLVLAHASLCCKTDMGGHGTPTCGTHYGRICRIHNVGE